MISIEDIRHLFRLASHNDDYVIDKSGAKTIELIGATFLADEPTIFGNINEDYCQRELDWYNSKSLKVSDIPGKTPKIWEDVSSIHGEINSNYGYLIYSEENGNQYDNVLKTLKRNSGSRQGNMIYTRPTMHADCTRDGMSDFVCTDSVTYLIRDNKLVAHVKMRSNDVVFGYKNDLFWQKHVLHKLADDLGIEAGEIVWTATSLHMYERHFFLL